MKSRKIKCRNLPTDPAFIEKVISLKPTGVLLFILFVGGGLLFAKAYLVTIGIVLMLLAFFAIAIMPDRTLFEFTKDYLVLFNQKNRDMCMLVYYDEILYWQYEYHNNYDLLVIQLMDGTTEKQEAFSYHSIKHLMCQHAGAKQQKSVRIRKEYGV